MTITKEQVANPQTIADSLIEEYGLDGAIKVAQEGTAASLNESDNYSVSVWREIKRVLNERKSK